MIEILTYVCFAITMIAVTMEVLRCLERKYDLGLVREILDRKKEK